jgi:uncharacterized membrane protein YbhN (UPF0104 family)
VVRALLRSRVVAWLVTAGILAYLASTIDMTRAARAIGGVPVAVLAMVMLLVAMDRAVMVGRWVLLLRAADVAIATGAAARIYLVSSFVGSYLLAGVGAEAMRAWSLRDRTNQGSEALASVTVDRVLGVLSLVLLMPMGALASTASRDRLAPTALAIGGLVILAAVALLWADVVVRAGMPAAWLETAPGRNAMRVVDALGRYRARRRTIALVFALSILVQLLRITQAWLLGLGLGIGVPLQHYLLFMPLGLVALLLPVSIAGFGLPQGVIVWLLRPYGVPESEAFALSTLIILTGLAGNLPGLVLALRSRET